MSAIILMKYPECRGTLIDAVDHSKLSDEIVKDIWDRCEYLYWPCEEQIAGRQFDLVLSMDVLEHIPDYRSALLALFLRVKLGGYLYIQTPSVYPSPNWPTRLIYKNKVKALFGKNDPGLHVHHGISCKALYDICKQHFKPLVVAEDSVVDGTVHCDFKPRTHVLLQKNF